MAAEQRNAVWGANEVAKSLGNLLAIATILSVFPSMAFASPDQDLKCMEKLVKTIFLFKRNPARTPEDFVEHYIHHHAVLGRRLNTSLRGYTVNLVQRPGAQDPDSFTEHWVPEKADGFPDWSTPTPDEQKIVTADDVTMFDRSGKDGGTMGGGPYIVKKEVTVMGEPLQSPLYEATPELKTILFYTDASQLPASPPIGARRVVDSYPSYIQVGDTKVKPDIAVFRSVWSSKPIDAKGVRSLQVKEYRQIVPPSMNWCSN